MARHRIKRHEVFWWTTGLVILWVFVVVALKVWHVAKEPEMAVREEQVHRKGMSNVAPGAGDVSRDVQHNFSNIKEGKFLEPAKWPQPPPKRQVILPAQNGDEKPGAKEPSKGYYNDY